MVLWVALNLSFVSHQSKLEIRTIMYTWLLPKDIGKRSFYGCTFSLLAEVCSYTCRPIGDRCDGSSWTRLWEFLKQNSKAWFILINSSLLCGCNVHRVSKTTGSPKNNYYLPKNVQVCFQLGSNRRPCACEAHVITTTLRKRANALRKSKTHILMWLLSSVG